MDHLFVFCGDGVVKDFIGNYTEYRTFIKDYEAAQKAEKRPEKPAVVIPSAAKESKKRKLTWKEQQELKSLPAAPSPLLTSSPPPPATASSRPSWTKKSSVGWSSLKSD